MVNHSCAGNALVSYSERGHLQLVVVRRVEKEEEITVKVREEMLDISGHF